MRNRTEPRRVKRKHPPVPVVTGSADLVGPLDPDRFRETVAERRPLLAAVDESGTLRPHTTAKQPGE